MVLGSGVTVPKLGANVLVDILYSSVKCGLNLPKRVLILIKPTNQVCSNVAGPLVAGIHSHGTAPRLTHRQRS